MIHKTAEVFTSHVGVNTQIWQNVIVLENALIGDNCNINCHCFIENDVKIGNNVTIKCGVYIWDGLIIEDDVFIGPNVTFTNDLFPRSKQFDREILNTVIKQGASIGAGAVILAGITIGRYSMIGAGSLITKSIPDYSLWYGNPAEQKGYVTKSNTMVSLDLTDKMGNKYMLKDLEPVKIQADF
jgi:UDP-2-acetamido-3-amino-2,3-dideoxy-glucuronate N-acetyltransferase